MSSIASVVTKTVTAASTAASATPSDRATPQGGILEGSNPSKYDPKNPIFLFIIQVSSQSSRWKTRVPREYNSASSRSEFTDSMAIVRSRICDRRSAIPTKENILEFSVNCFTAMFFVLTCDTGRNYHHLLPPPPLPPLEAATTSRHCRSHWWHHTWALSNDADSRIPSCHFPNRCHGEPEPGCKLRTGLVPVPRRPRGQYAHVSL